MSKTSMERKGRNEKIYFRLGITIVTLALVAMTGLGTVAYAASGGNPSTQLEDERGIFNPFTLNVIKVSSDSGSTAVISSVARPEIRIPVRPVLRSFFRPPLVTVAP
jgi:hypothetical protein